jgi:hypothetical protein
MDERRLAEIGAATMAAVAILLELGLEVGLGLELELVS